MGHRLRVLELYCGIGGCAAAVGDRAQIVAAVDINLKALEVVAHNFPHPRVARTLESIPTNIWREWQADLWWLSPPCQPYTQRGRRRDLDDPRAVSRPAWVTLDREHPTRFASTTHPRELRCDRRSTYSAGAIVRDAAFLPPYLLRPFVSARPPSSCNIDQVCRASSSADA